jgi:hypothetical protein
MRFPDIPPMKADVDLFEKVGLQKGKELVPYLLSSINNVMVYNCTTTFGSYRVKSPLQLLSILSMSALPTAVQFRIVLQM